METFISFLKDSVVNSDIDKSHVVQLNHLISDDLVSWKTNPFVSISKLMDLIM